MYTNDLKESRSNPEKLPGNEDDRTEMGLAIVGSLERALTDKRLSDTYLRKILQILVKSLFMEGGDNTAVEQFEAEYGMCSPSFLVLSPGNACNLRCTGCYADSTENTRALEWSTVDRMIAEKHYDCFFMVFTNGTLINE
ncbi:MAG TPA: hypothetical protein VKF38_16690 [Anaerolineaceae bacterium]|nr:hypothetical protein [Anaerolineaceae bacterium]